MLEHVGGSERTDHAREQLVIGGASFAGDQRRRTRRGGDRLRRRARHSGGGEIGMGGLGGDFVEEIDG
jgi:hypothetical protein